MMIGTFCKSLQHLKHSVGDLGTKKLLFLVNRNPELCEAMLVGDQVVIFNHFTTNLRSFGMYGEKVENAITSFLSKNKRYSSVFVLNDNTLEWFNRHFNYCPIILLPNDFDTKYESFIKNNNKQFSQTLHKFGLEQHHAFAIYSYILSNESINFFSWILKNVLANRVPFHLIFLIMQWNEKYAQMANKLSKGTITAYSGTQQIIQLLSELNLIRRGKRANDSVMQFNPAQKRILKDHIEEPKTKDILNMFGRLSDVKRQNFIRKMSTIEEFDEIIKQMGSLCEVHFNWTKESLKEYLSCSEALDYSIVLEKDNVVLLKVGNYETVKRLAKTTNWCISKNKRYWNDYVENNPDATQYVLFDFNLPEDSELSIVGFTALVSQGITHAHSFTNQNLMGNSVDNRIVTFLPVRRNNIHQILSYHNIPTSIFIKNSNLTFHWDKKSLMETVLKWVNEENVNILCDEGDKLAFSVEDCDIYHIFPKECFRHFDRSTFDSTSIFFADFSKNEADVTKLMVCFVYEEDRGMEYATSAYNSALRETNVTFDSLLSDFDMPYDTIKRINNIPNRFMSAMNGFDLKTIDKILSDKSMVRELSKNKSKNTCSGDILVESILTRKTTSLIDIFYKNNVALCDVFEENQIQNLILSLCMEIGNRSSLMNRLPNDSDFQNVLQGNVPSEQRCILFGFSKIYNMLATNEPYTAFTLLGKNINCITSTPIFIRMMMTGLTNHISNYSTNDVLMTRIVITALYNQLYDIVELVLNNTKSQDIINYIQSSLPKDHELCKKYFSVARC